MPGTLSVSLSLSLSQSSQNSSESIRQRIMLSAGFISPEYCNGEFHYIHTQPKFSTKMTQPRLNKVSLWSDYPESERWCTGVQVAGGKNQQIYTKKVLRCHLNQNLVRMANNALTEGLDPNQHAMCAAKPRSVFALHNMLHRSHIWINHHCTFSASRSHSRRLSLCGSIRRIPFF